MNQMLLIQDDARIGRAMKRLLNRFGYDEPTWLGGIRSLEVENGILQGFDIESRPLDVDLRKHVLAFVDGHLKIGKVAGWEVMPMLREARIICISISTIYGELLRQYGAEHETDPGDFKDFIEERLRAIYDAACLQRSSVS